MTRSLRFPETMVGDVTFTGSTTATDRRTYPFTMHLQWFIPDLDAFIADSRHEVVITGRVICDALGGEATVPSGAVELFAEDAGRTVMNYRLDFAAGNGEPVRLLGAKQIVHDRAWDLWPDTTTLPIEIRRTADEPRPVLGGTLHLTLPRVLLAVLGMRAAGGPLQQLRTILAFDRFFVAKLASVYLAAVRRGRPLAPVAQAVRQL